MGSYLLFVLASLFLVPWGLCLPQGHSDLVARQSTPPADACPAGYLPADVPLWFPISDGYVAIQIHVDTNGLKGYFLIVVEVATGEAHTSSSHLASADVDISPFYTTGTTMIHQDADYSHYQLWVDSLDQKTPNFYQDAVDLAFAGVWPRVDMEVNRTANNEYLAVTWMNPIQGAYAVSLVDYEMYNCGKGS